MPAQRRSVSQTGQAFSAPRTRVKRSLVRWNDKLDKELLLWINHCCSEAGIKIPFDKVAYGMGKDFSEGAIVQHLAKIRNKAEAEGFHAPPATKKGTTKTAPSTLYRRRNTATTPRTAVPARGTTITAAQGRRGGNRGQSAIKHEVKDELDTNQSTYADDYEGEYSEILGQKGSITYQGPQSLSWSGRYQYEMDEERRSRRDTLLTVGDKPIWQYAEPGPASRTRSQYHRDSVLEDIDSEVEEDESGYDMPAEHRGHLPELKIDEQAQAENVFIGAGLHRNLNSVEGFQGRQGQNFGSVATNFGSFQYPGQESRATYLDPHPNTPLWTTLPSGAPKQTGRVNSINSQSSCNDVNAGPSEFEQGSINFGLGSNQGMNNNTAFELFTPNASIGTDVFAGLRHPVGQPGDDASLYSMPLSSISPKGPLDLSTVGDDKFGFLNVDLSTLDDPESAADLQVSPTDIDFNWE